MDHPFAQAAIKLKEQLRRLTKRKFFRNVAIVASGTAGAQAITMIFSPVVTRLYGPEAFGLLGTFVALVAMIAPLAALSYPIAIVLPKEDNEAKNLIRLSIYISLIIATVLTIAILIAGHRLMILIGAGSIAAFALLMPLNVLFGAWLQVSQQWMIRKKKFQATAKIAVVQALALNFAKVCIGWFHPVAAVLIILTTIGTAFHVVMLYIGGKTKEKGNDFLGQPPPRKPLLEIAKNYYDFPLYRSPQVFILAISKNLPVLMLAVFFGPVSAGYYAICRRVLTIPSGLITNAVGDVFYPRLSEANHRGENLTKLIVKATIALSVVGFFPFAAIVAFGPRLFEFVFGAEWVTAGEYARWLSLWLFFMFINRPSVVAVPILGIQKGFLVYELFSTGSKLLAMYVGFIIFNDDKLVVALLGVFGALSYIFLILWVIKLSVYYRKGDQINLK